MRPTPAVVAALVACALYLLSLGSVPLEGGEARDAEIAREYAAGRILDVPRLNGVPHYRNPPLSYWATAAGFAAVGGTDPLILSGARREATGGVEGPAALVAPPEWAGRLAPALLSLATVLTVFLLARGWLSERHAALAAILLATAPQAVSSGRSLGPEPAFACFLTIAVGASLTALRAVEARRFFGFLACAGAGLALAFLARGWVAPVLYVVAVAAATVAEHGFLGVFRIRTVVLALAGAVFLAPAVGLWAWLVSRAGGDLAAALGHLRPGLDGWWFYLLEALDGLFPWIVLVPLAGLGRAHALAPGGRPEFRLRQLTAWAVAMLVILSLLEPKRDALALPIFPPLAILAATAILEPPLRGPLATPLRLAWEAFGTVLTGAAVALPISLGAWRWGTAPAEVTGLARLAPLSTAAGLALAGVLVLLAGRRDAGEREAPLPYPLTRATLFGLAVLSWVLLVDPAPARPEEGRSLRPLASDVARAVAATPDGLLFGYRLSERLNAAIPYELGRTFPGLERPEEIRAALARSPDARVILDRASYEAAGRPGGPPLLEATSGRFHVLVVGPIRVR